MRSRGKDDCGRPAPLPRLASGFIASLSFRFNGASNDLGEFEIGVTARLFGPVMAAPVGGFALLLVTVFWAPLFPQLRRVDRLG